MTDVQFLQIAKIVAGTSKCVSVQVGAVIAKEGRIISTGYNGTPSGYLNCCDVHSERGAAHSEWSNRYEIHAEQNALLYAAKYGISVKGATLYTTVEPCFQCLKMIVASGISRIVYDEPYYREEIDIQSKLEFSSACSVLLERCSLESTTQSPRPG